MTAEKELDYNMTAEKAIIERSAENVMRINLRVFYAGIPPA